jgi:multidrug efflux pump subunit AcrA (membrane-fusion protein)
MSVRQRQTLFYLPDLSEMEIQVALNESVVDRVSPGMRVRARFEALPQLELPGEVVSVNQIPVQQGDNGEDVRYFQGIIKVDQSGAGLKPGMTARVEIILPPRPNVLAVPHRAVVADQGGKVCWVLRDDQLVRREVRLGQATPNFAEILEGLAEGEQVALDPPVRSGRPQSLSGFLEKDWVVATSPTPTVAAPRSRPKDQSPSQASNRRKNRRKSADETEKPRGRTQPQR